MLFILVVLAWLTMQYWGGAAAFHRDEYFEAWRHWLNDRYSNVQGSTGLSLLLILVPVVGLALILELFGGWLFGLVGLVINIIVLLYACGRGDFYASFGAYREALEGRQDSPMAGTFNDSLTDTEAAAAFSAASEHYDVHASDFARLHERVRASISYQAYERWFAVALWFLLLGAPGALLYRLAGLVVQDASSADEVPADTAGESATSDENTGDSTSVVDVNDASKANEVASEIEVANVITGFMDWLPVRLWALGYAVCGDYGSIMHELKSRFFARISSRQLLVDINFAAVYGDAGFASDRISVEEARKELDSLQLISSRVMILMLGAIAFVTVVL